MTVFILHPADVQCRPAHRDASRITRVVRCAKFRLQKSFNGGRHSLRPRADTWLSMEYLDTNLGSGVPMPRYLTQHTLACLTRQGAEALAQRMQAGGLAHAERILVNMLEGKMFVEFRADSRENLEAWLKTEGMHFDFLVRIEWEMNGDKLQIAE
jgi:hypothetical protein